MRPTMMITIRMRTKTEPAVPAAEAAGTVTEKGTEKGTEMTESAALRKRKEASA